MSKRLYATSRIHGPVNVAGPGQYRRFEQEAIRIQPHRNASMGPANMAGSWQYKRFEQEAIRNLPQPAASERIHGASKRGGPKTIQEVRAGGYTQPDANQGPVNLAGAGQYRRLEQEAAVTG